MAICLFIDPYMCDDADDGVELGNAKNVKSISSEMLPSVSAVHVATLPMLPSKRQNYAISSCLLCNTMDNWRLNFFAHILLYPASLLTFSSGSFCLICTACCLIWHHRYATLQPPFTIQCTASNCNSTLYCSRHTEQWTLIEVHCYVMLHMHFMFLPSNAL